MDRSLDIAVWENVTYKPDLIHLSCWRPEAHQASSWLFASSKRLSPARSSLMFFTLAGARILLRTAQRAGRIMGPVRPRAASRPSRCTGES